MCRPPFLCGSVCAGALFHAGGGIALRGLRPLHPRAEPGRHLQPQQKRYPAGGLPCLPPADPAFPEAAGGAWRFWSPASPAFSFIFCPHPPAPLPLRGRGRLKVYFAGGFAPGTPALNRLRHWLASAFPIPRGGACPRRHLLDLPELSPAGDVPLRHLLDLPRGRGPSQTPKFLSPGPPSPWLPALPIGSRFLSVLRRTAGSLRGVPAWQRL